MLSKVQFWLDSIDHPLSLQTCKLFNPTSVRGKRVANQLASQILEQQARGLIFPQLPAALGCILCFLTGQEGLTLLTAIEQKIKTPQKKQLLLTIAYRENKLKQDSNFYGQSLCLMASAKLLQTRRPLLFKERCYGTASEEILADLIRTFQDKNTIRQGKLASLLHAVSQSIESGYFQGLNMLVHFVCQYEIHFEQAYWVLLHILKRQCLHSLICNDFQLYRKFQHVVSQCLNIKWPDISLRLREMTPGISYFMMRWVLSLFTVDLHPQLVRLIWLYFMHSGLNFLGGCILAIFQRLQHHIQSLSEEGLNQMLKHQLADSIGLQTQQFIEQATKLQVPWQAYQDLCSQEDEYICLLDRQDRFYIERQKEYVTRYLDELAEQEEEKEITKSNADEQWDEQTLLQQLKKDQKMPVFSWFKQLITRWV